jgi:hypothetical protein
VQPLRGYLLLSMQQQHAPALVAARHGMRLAYTHKCAVVSIICLQECDELVELQVAARVARMREVELAAARQEAAAK